MKVMRSLILAVIIVLSLAACSSAPDHTGAGEEETSSMGETNPSAEETYTAKYEEGMACVESARFEEAIALFSAAIELDAQKPDAYISRGDTYFAMVDAEESETVRDEAYQNAKADYETAIDLEESNIQTYQKLANVCLALGDTESAAAILERGVNVTEDSGLQDSLQQLKITISTREVLNTIPYFGDVNKCSMTVEQATAYAQLMADGITGKIPVYDGGAVLSLIDENLLDATVFWDKGFTVFGYAGNYQTSRNYAILCDFASDGNPYLLLTNGSISETDGEASFSVYGWQSGAVKCVAEYEFKSAFWWFTLTDDGIWEDSQQGNDIDSIYYEFESGTLKKRESRSEQTTYAIDEAVPGSCTLREMITYLNQYTAALSGGTAQTVAVPERSSTQLMAKAMLNVLDGYDGRIADTKLVDMDGDGQKELLVIYFDIGVCCDVYSWENGSLSSQTYGGGLTDSISLVQDSTTGEYGIGTFVGTDSSGYCYRYPSHSIEVLESFDPGEADGISWYSKIVRDSNGTHSYELSKSEFDALINQNIVIEEFESYESTGGQLEETKAALNKMLKG